MIRDDLQADPVNEPREATEPYEHPEIVDFGSLKELTLSGSAPLSDSFGGASGGGGS